VDRWIDRGQGYFLGIRSPGTLASTDEYSSWTGEYDLVRCGIFSRCCQKAIKSL